MPKQAVAGVITLMFNNDANQYDIKVNSAALENFLNNEITNIPTDKEIAFDQVRNSVQGYFDKINTTENNIFDVSFQQITHSNTLKLGLLNNDVLADLVEQYIHGTHAEVSITDLSDGNHWGYQADDQVISASTYKLYVAYSELKSVESGTSWDSSLGGTTLNNCMTKMIIQSDNACAEAWLIPRNAEVLNDAYSVGVSHNTTNVNQDYFMTTANDLNTLLTKIQTGNILQVKSRDKLTGLMKQQVYRNGIPAGIGSNGQVADKVGFLSTASDGILNDAGICFTNKGNYTIVIMTDGSSWGDIASLTKAIYEKL
jgi:beta-lactamase class A